MTLPLPLLSSDEFLARTLAISASNGLEHYLRSQPEVRTVGEAFARETGGEEQVRGYIRNLLSRFRPGKRFAYDTALAALIVSMENVPSAYISELIDELANLDVAEIPHAPRIARTVRNNRRSFVIPATTKVEKISTALPIQMLRAQTFPARGGGVTDLPPRILRIRSYG